MNRKTRFFGTLAVTALFGIAAVAASINHKEEKTKAAVETAITNFQTDWDNMGVEPASAIISYHLISSGDQVQANSKYVTDFNDLLTTPTYALIRLKNHNNHNLVLTIYYRITSNADGCTAGSVVSSTLNNSSYTRYSSGSGCYFVLGANDDAVFRVELNSGAYSTVRIGVGIGETVEKKGSFTIQSWKTFDSDSSTLVDTLYQFNNLDKATIKVTSVLATSEYKNLTSASGGTILPDFEGIPVNFYDVTHNTYDNPNDAVVLRTFTGYKPVQFRKKTSDAAARLLVGYGTDVSTEGAYLIISRKSESYTLSEISLTHRTDVGWHDNLYYYTSSDGGTNWSEESTKASWTGSENGRTSTIALDAGVTDIKLVNYANGVSGDRALIGLASISVDYNASNVFELSFDTQGGTSVASQFIDPSKSDVTVRPSSNPTHANEDGYRYSFAGWYDAAEGGNEFVFGSTILEDTVVYAHWNRDLITHYVVTFDTQGGTSVASQNVAVGGTATKPTDPTKTDAIDPTRYVYKFKDWYTDTGMKNLFNFSTVITDDMTLYAGWERSAYIPTGASNYNVKSGLHDNNNTGWGDGEAFNSFASRSLLSTSTFNKSLTPIKLDISSSDANSGMKRNNWEFVVNDTVMTLTVQDASKYITSVRIEALPQEYTESRAQNATITAGGVIYDTQKTPWSAYNHQVWLANFDPSDYVTTFDFNVPVINTSKGVGLTNIIIEYATFTIEDYAILYARSFNDANVCGTSDYDGVDDVKWGLQEAAYLALSPEARSYLTNYDGSNAEILECLERYDMAVSKHGEDYDFMGRIEAGKISAYEPIINPLTKADMSDTFALITVIALTVLSIGAGFALYKKKSNNQ